MMKRPVCATAALAAQTSAKTEYGYLVVLGGIHIIIYKPKDLQRMFGLSKNTVYKLFNSDAFPSFRIGKQMFVERNALIEWAYRYQYKEFLI